jgi:alpha-beta hydrolase superfamily lysophospholipase
MLDYIVCARALKGGLFSSEPGPTRFLKVPDQKNPATSLHVNKSAFLEEVVGKPNAQKCQDIVVYVHDYNVTQSDLIQRHRKIGSGLAMADYKGEFLSFDWPAKGNASNYLEDCSDARRVALQLVDDCITTFATWVKKGCTINLRLLAHSTGGFIIREAFDDADDRNSIAKTNWSVSQICFVAADVSFKDMVETSSNPNTLYHHCVRLTNYDNPLRRRPQTLQRQTHRRRPTRRPGGSPRIRPRQSRRRQLRSPLPQSPPHHQPRRRSHLPRLVFRRPRLTQGPHLHPRRRQF